MKKLLLLLRWGAAAFLLLLLPLADLRLPLRWWSLLLMAGLGAAFPLGDVLAVLLPLQALLLLAVRQYLPLLLGALLAVFLLQLAVLIICCWFCGGMRRVMARRREEVAETEPAA